MICGYFVSFNEDVLYIISCWIIYLYFSILSIVFSQQTSHLTLVGDRPFRPPPLDLALPTRDRYDALQSHGPHGETGEFLGKRMKINFSFENRTDFFFGGKMMLKTSDRLKPLNPKVFETNKKYTQRMHQIWSSNLTVSFDNKSPHPPNWWSNNLLSMVPCVVLCHWWWLEPRSNVAVPPLRPRWHISDSAAIFMTFPDDSGWEQEVTNKIHRLVKISGDCFF